MVKKHKKANITYYYDYDDYYDYEDSYDINVYLISGQKFIFNQNNVNRSSVNDYIEEELLKLLDLPLLDVDYKYTVSLVEISNIDNISNIDTSLEIELELMNKDISVMAVISTTLDTNHEDVYNYHDYDDDDDDFYDHLYDRY